MTSQNIADGSQNRRRTVAEMLAQSHRSDPVEAAESSHSSQVRLADATPTNVRTYGLTENLQDQVDLLALRNARETTPIRPRCQTHGVSTPCAGCRADELVSGTANLKPTDEPDGRMRAAGER